MARLTSFVGMLKEAAADWSQDNAPRLGAALSYYTIFSLAPLLLISIGVAGLVFGQEAAQGRIVHQIDGLLGTDGARAVQDMLENARKPATGTLATLAGFVTLLFGATGAFTELRSSLNTVWEVETPPTRGLFGMLKARFLSFTLVLGVGFLLLVSLVLSAALAAAGALFDGRLPGGDAVLEALNFVVSLAVVTLLFAMIYKLLPDTHVEWRDVWFGAGVTAALFTLGKFLIGLYLGRGSVGSAYGAAGSLVIILVWVYYAAQILFFGAELTQVYARRHGSRIGSEDSLPAAKEIESQKAPAAEEAGPPVPAAASGVASAEAVKPVSVLRGLAVSAGLVLVALVSSRSRG
jgi:membrane protein